MALHNENTGHSVALSVSDASVWCYSCDSYITSPAIAKLTKRLGDIKFPEVDVIDAKPEGKSSPDENVSPSVFRALEDLTYAGLVAGLQDKKYQKIVFLTGAGISVAAGIPDLRTPGTGLYAKVAELGLPYPEAIFSLDFLKKDPSPFFKIANGFLTYKANPVKSHYFIKKVADEGMLLMNFTQNIDGLELDAGLPFEKLVQAHGHMRTARCCECSVSVPIAEFFEAVAQETPLYCTVCEVSEAERSVEQPRGIIKPDIVFFGENLPMSFLSNARKISEADLVFVMGTSLKVFPFAGLLDLIQPKVPIVLVNREDPGRIDRGRHPVIFLEGEIEENLAKLVDDVGWELDKPFQSGEKA
uniref:Deacetylase sirtuin-type domain-containing protein n=1 Tax=Spumella elongata TaxID=89044 RepID=A0A7S3HG30_9STRA